MTTTTGGAGSPVSRRTPEPPPVSRHDTLIDLLTQVKRDAVPMRPAFVQQGKGKATKPGPLASFVSRHDERGLDAYLLIHAMASTPPWDCDYPAVTWIRALGLDKGAERDSALAASSKIMRRLAERKLITRKRAGRRSVVYLLDEDGSGDEYTLPATAKERYFKLPHAYWTERHYETLDLPAKAMLLIALSLRPGFPLPYERGPAWYGLSADSTEKGLRDLQNAGFLDFDHNWLRNVRSETGWTEQRLYSLTGPYTPPKPARRPTKKKSVNKKVLAIKSATSPRPVTK